MIKQLPIIVCDIKFNQPFWGGNILNNPQVGFQTSIIPSKPDTVVIYTDLLCTGDSMKSDFKFSFRLVIPFELKLIDLTEKHYEEALHLTTEHMNRIFKTIFSAEVVEIIVATIPFDRYEEIVYKNIQSLRQQ
jgi:hypothetical protein